MEQAQHRLSYWIINGITIYRILASILLFSLVFYKELDWFKWLLLLSFFTDMIDGYLARKYKVASILGAKLDSIGDDLTVFAAIAGLFAFKRDFLLEQILPISILLGLFIFQIILSFFRYGKLTSFHTYLAKIAALAQGVFLILTFLLPEPIYPLFYVALAFTALDLVEEIILTFLLRKWRINVKGLYWVLKEKKPL